MKNKRMVLTLIAGAMITAAVFGRDYNLNERETINLSGVDEVVFNLEEVSCSLCISSLDILSDLRGDGSGRDMALSLNGSVSSNREKALPSFIIEEGRKTVTVQLYPDRKSFFGLSRSGTAHFEAVLPGSFDGIVTVRGSSNDIAVRNFDVAEMDVKNGSGNLSINDIRGEEVSLKVSSGDIAMGRIEGSKVYIRSASRNITIDNLQASAVMEVSTSSGRITGRRIAGNQVLFNSSSADILLEVLEAGDAAIKVSSGDVQLDTVTTETLDIKLSSDDLEIITLESKRTEINTSGETLIKSGRGEIILEGSSGDVDITLSTLSTPLNLNISSGDITIALPENSAFDALFDTSSGCIRSEFPVLGNLTADGDELKGTINGGGVPVTLQTSSGNIQLLVR